MSITSGYPNSLLLHEGNTVQHQQTLEFGYVDSVEYSEFDEAQVNWDNTFKITPVLQKDLRKYNISPSTLIDGGKKWFCSDLHFRETRLGIEGGLDLFHRPFESTEENDRFLLDQILNTPFVIGDELYFLGDLTSNYDEKVPKYMEEIRTKFPQLPIHLIIGNYDEKFPQVYDLFDTVQHTLVVKLDGFDVLLNHYPSKCQEWLDNHPQGMSLFGHIHSLGKVKERKLNVGVDAWWGKPVSEKKILFTFNAMLKHYDQDVYCK